MYTNISSKKLKENPTRKKYIGRYGALLKEADDLEQYAKQQLEEAKTEKKRKGVRAAQLVLKATKSLLEHYNN